MPEHFNRLSPAEAERLALLAEECGEVMQAIGKILRHGYESRHPNGGETNRCTLEREIGDLHAALDLMINAGDINDATITHWTVDKMVRVQSFLHHQ